MIVRGSMLGRFLRFKWLAFVIIFLSVIILIIPDLFLYPGADYGVYSNGAQLINRGAVLYSDYWDHKGPGIYIYLALWQRIFGSSWWSLKASLIPIYFLWGLAIYLFSTLTFKKRWMALVVALLSVYYVMRLGFDPNRSGAILVFSTAFELLALYAIGVLFSYKQTPKKLYLSGMAGVVLAATAFLIRQTSIGAGLIILGSCCYFFVKKDQRIRYVITGVLSGGMLAVLIASFTVWGFDVEISILYDRLIFFNSVYSASYVSFDSVLAWWNIFMFDGILWILAAASVLWLTPKQNEMIFKISGLRYALVAGLVATFLAMMAVKPQSFYKLQYLPYLLMIAVLVVAYIIENTREKLLFLKTVRVVIVLLVGIYSANIFLSDMLALKNWYSTAESYHYQIANYPDQVVAEKIKSIPGNKTLFVLGNRPWIYLWSGLTNPTQYYYTNGLFSDGYLSLAQFESFVAEFKSKLPDTIVIWSNYPAKQDDRYNWNFVEKMNGLVEQNYELYETVAFENWQVWPYQAFSVDIYVKK